MKRYILFLILSSLYVTTQAQATKKILESGLKRSEAAALLSQEYISSNGWFLSPGDTLYLGQGINPDHSYAFFISEGGGRLYSGFITKVIITKLKLVGRRKREYACFAKVKTSIGRFALNIESAIKYGEIVSREQFLKNESDMAANTCQNRVTGTP